MDGLPAAFDRTSLVDLSDKNISHGPRSPWSPERRDRKLLSPLPNPEMPQHGGKRRGWRATSNKTSLFFTYNANWYHDLDFVAALC
jgi:hypothetical protein